MYAMTVNYTEDTVTIRQDHAENRVTLRMRGIDRGYDATVSIRTVAGIQQGAGVEGRLCLADIGPWQKHLPGIRYRGSVILRAEESALEHRNRGWNARPVKGKQSQ
jgi:hypothetical protein